MSSNVLVSLIAAVLLLPAAAFAKDSRDRARGGDVSLDERTGTLNVRLPEDPKIHLRAMAGVTGFSGLDGSLQPGPALGVQVAAEPARFAEIELGYQASRNGIDDARVGDGEGMYRHNVSAFAKLGPILDETIRPFVGAGIGASYANVTDGAEAVYRNDFFQELPIGAGIDYASPTRGLTAGVRATWSPLFNDEFAEPTPAADNPDDVRLIVGQFTVGGRF